MTLSEEFVDITIEANSLQEYAELLEQMFKDGYSVVDTEEIGVVRIAHLRKTIMRADDVDIVGSKSVGMLPEDVVINDTIVSGNVTTVLPTATTKRKRK